MTGSTGGGIVLRVGFGVMRDVERHADHEPGQASGVEARVCGRVR